MGMKKLIVALILMAAGGKKGGGVGQWGGQVGAADGKVWNWGGGFTQVWRWGRLGVRRKQVGG